MSQGLGALLPPAHLRSQGSSFLTRAATRSCTACTTRSATPSAIRTRRCFHQNVGRDDVHDEASATTPTPTTASSPSRASTADVPSGRCSIGSARPGRAHRLVGGLYTAVLRRRSRPHWWCSCCCPSHFMMGPIHGAIVNWCGHKYGYRNFDNGDDSRNTLLVRLHDDGRAVPEQPPQVRHVARTSRRAGSSSTRPIPVIKLLAWLKIVDLGPAPQFARYPARDVDVLA